ncbi:hypothetical protein OS493_014855 [Desmophyllum pertusum]|uniref:Fibronectin type-II domain-containing protein n=1 Tax=Desmophyllum pertusum TaxID=174260 RepID=A0A9W9YGS1_9CNID|nr:hypothetical protein OS493_014855 [Desmophyllum pertusum]
MIDTNFSFNIGTLWFPGCKDGVTTVGGNALGACCKFPFIYKGTVHWRCTDQEANKKWCSVTKVFDLDKKWGYCTCVGGLYKERHRSKTGGGVKKYDIPPFNVPPLLTLDYIITCAVTRPSE